MNESPNPRSNRSAKGAEIHQAYVEGRISANDRDRQLGRMQVKTRSDEGQARKVLRSLGWRHLQGTFSLDEVRERAAGILATFPHLRAVLTERGIDLEETGLRPHHGAQTSQPATIMSDESQDQNTTGTWQRNTSAAHQAKKRKHEETVAAMPVPTGFSSVQEFLTKGFREAVESLPLGGAAAMTAELQCDAAAISKWMRGKRLPGLDKYDRVLAWYERWKARTEGRLPTVMPKAEAPAVIRQAGSRGLALQRLSPPIQERLNRTAKRQNVDPLKLAEQILDRHLDS